MPKRKRPAVVNRDESPGFILFGRLPKEIRLMIWGLCRPEKRVINISEQMSTTAGGNLKGRAHATYSIPAALHICGESREVGLKTYKFTLGPRLQHEPLLIDYTQDTIFSDFPGMKDFFGSSWSRPSTFQSAGLEEMDQLFMNLRHVAIDMVNCKQAWKKLDLLSPFKNLQSLVVMLPPGFDKRLKERREKVDMERMRNALEQGIEFARRKSLNYGGRVGNLGRTNLPKINFVRSCELDSWIHAGRGI